ncbi:phage tail protein [Limosilactobacillus reuteri]|uniref:phage tail spike protein n=1 Tax=Limosilactobacillus reuteri TaxID=1598 RepID=UPI001E637D11|nr:phage tail spike protein [Limosilactobacillus reuteri]MCC4410518.1 phage tail protein [Limosilactobacillus reuteri]MCC4414804.1 phage tail protein [Limosilactobacillus reuteri]
MRMYLLDKKQRVKRWLKDNDFLEAEMTEEINAANQINFSTPLKDRIADNIYYVAIPTPRSKQKYLLFKLLSERVKNDRIEYQGIEEAYDELKQYGYIKDIRPNDRTAEEMLKMVLEPTRWTLGNVPETNHQSTNFYYITYLEALQKIVGLFNIELTFEVTIDPKSNKITRRQVNVYTEQGQRTGKRFEYGSNLLTVQQEQDSQELITALVGRGKGELVSEGYDDTPDGYGRRITFADVVWTKKDGHPVDKPAGQEYLVDPEATALYGFSDGNPRIGLTVFEDIEDPVELINATWRALQSLKRPKVSFKADVTDVGQLGLGDTVAIIRHDLKIEYFTRVYKVKHNLLNENDNQIELGDDFSGHSITSSLIKVDEIANEARETAGHAAIAANGKNNNYYSSVQPLAPVEGDIWYKDLGNGETDMYQYHNGGWVFIQSTRDLHVVENQVKEAQQGLNQAKADIINNKQKADTDIENLNKSIKDNKKFADESLKKLNDSVTNLQGQYDNNVVPNLNKVMADASDALQKYITAQNSIADLTKQAQKQGKDIADVTNTVKGLDINYANLAGDVNSTKVDVKGLQTTIGTANGDIAQLKLDAQNLQTMLAGKVDNTAYTNFVNLTNQALNARLTASDLSGYAKTVDVQATANGLRVDLNSVTDRMNNLKVGGRNLIPNSGTDIVIESKTTDPYPAWDNKAVYWDLTPGETYTFSASATNTNGVKEASIRIWNSAVNKEAPGNLVFPADGRRHSTTFTIPKDGVSYSVWLYAGHMGKLEGKNFATTYHHPMLQIGNAGTEWSPNPQDIQNDLSQLSARITTTSQQFSSYYTKSETDSKADTAKNDAVNAIKSDSNWTGLKNVLTNSGFLQTADGFLQKVQQTTIPMFSGGGVNLARNTSDKWSSAWSDFNGSNNQTKQLGRFYTRNLNVGDWITIAVNYQYQDLSGSGMQIALQADGNVCGWNDGAIYPSDWQQLQASSTLKTGSIERHIKVTPSLIQNEYYAVQLRVDNASGGWLRWIYFQVNKGTVRPPWSPAPEDMATQSAFSELSQSLEGLRSTVGSNYGGLQSQISQSASEMRTDLTNKITGLQTQLTTTANGLDAKIGAIQVGGRNLLRNSNKDVSVTSRTTDGWPAWCNYNTGFTFEHGQTYTFSVEARNSTSKIPEASIRMWESSTNIQGYFHAFPADGKRHSITFTIPDDSHNYQLLYYAGHAGQVPGVDVTTTYHHPKLELGTMATDWTPAPEDTDQAFTEVNATINGLQSTVSSNHNDLQSQISQTAKNIRQEVSDKTNGLQTQITQQSNNFNVSLNKIQQTDGVNILRGTRDFSGDWDQLNNWYKDGWVDPNGNYAIKRKGAWGGAAQQRWLDVGTYTFSVYYYFEDSDSSTSAWVYAIPNNDKTLKITENSSSSLETTKDKWIKKVYTFTVTTPGTSAVRVETNSNTATIHVGSYKLEKGYKETPWTTSPYDIYMNPNVVTKILTSVQDLNNIKTEGNYVVRASNNTNSPIGNWLVVRVEGSGDRLHQTISADNDPNLSYTRTFNGSWSAWQRTVTGGNIMAQINMSAGTTLIQNDKIYMDSSSTIFSGKAFIPSAAITSLNADKITAGTLNAANVNIINLNANNITTGTINGQNLKIDLNTGNVEFQHGRIHNFSNTVDINLDQNYISTANYNTRALLKDGELQLTQPNLYDTNGNWYFRLYNGGGAGDAWAGASLIGRDSVIVANEANAQGATGFTSSPMGTATFSGLFTGKGTNNWMPTILGGAERGVFIKGGNQMSIKQNIMDPNDGGVFATGSPFISVGVDGPNNNWWGNRIVIDGEYLHVPTAWRHTTGGAPNLVVASDGALVRSTSASKYKTEIHRDYSTDYGDRLLELPTATWIDKGQKKRYQAGQRSIKPNKYFGMIAEDLADAGLDLFVSRNPQTHEIEGIQYERIAPALIPVIRKLKKKVQELEEKLNEQ